MREPVPQLGVALVVGVLPIICLILYIIRKILDWISKFFEKDRSKEPEHPQPRVFIVSNRRTEDLVIASVRPANSREPRESHLSRSYTAPPPEYTTIVIPEEISKPPEYVAPPSYSEALKNESNNNNAVTSSV